MDESEKIGPSPKIRGVKKKDTATIFIGPRCLWGPIYGFASLSLSDTPFADLTVVTLADEDTNSILADNTKREIQSNEAMQVM